jgi:DNA-binding MarR family transcriptional regulator
MPELSKMEPPYTYKQGQYLVFIYYYSKINDRPPAERDFQNHFRTTPPTVHQMILTLEKRGFISREAGQPRSIKLLLSRDQLLDLE